MDKGIRQRKTTYLPSTLNLISSYQESCSLSDEEVVDPKATLEACAKRIEGDESGHKHCTGQYFDYWHCIDKCVSSLIHLFSISSLGVCCLLFLFSIFYLLFSNLFAALFTQVALKLFDHLK
uniref:Complex III subunit VI n=1 Tax=Solanum tuberosum TaxID=4113 RepID=M1AT50_SOLTU